jgi:hypothetical protein
MTKEGWVRCWGSDSNGRATPTLAFAATEQIRGSDEKASEPKAAPVPKRAPAMDLPKIRNGNDSALSDDLNTEATGTTTSGAQRPRK